MLNNFGFTIVDCTRCGGTGHYSYNSQTGTICFKCNGSKTQVKGGKESKAWAELLDMKRNLTVLKLQVGDQVAYEGVWRTIAEIRWTSASKLGSSVINGVEATALSWDVEIVSISGVTFHISTTTNCPRVRRLMTRELVTRVRAAHGLSTTFPQDVAA